MSSPEKSEGKKLVFVGDSGVGKTCIISRFVQGTFTNNIASTMGASYATKSVEIPEINKNFTFDIWDTAGQEKYKALAKFFFQGAKMAVLVYDITRRDSFEGMKNSWYKQLRDNSSPDIVIGVAGNKSDLYDDEEVSEQEARDFAKEIGAIFALTSAQNNTGIDDLFKNMAKKYLNIDITTDVNHGGNKPVPKPVQKEEQNQEQKTIKIDAKNVAAKNKEQKQKKGPC